MKATSLEASKFIKDNELDFVFIDGNHRYEHVLQDLKVWTPKVRKGGIVSGHDYYEQRSGGVIRAVDEFVKDNNYELLLTEYDFNGHHDDKQPSWYFIKK